MRRVTVYKLVRLIWVSESLQGGGESGTEGGDGGGLHVEIPCL
jgi:hypothetical protein